MFNASMRLVLALKAERSKQGDGDLDAPEPSTDATEPGENAAPEAVLRAVDGEKPTEAVTTQTRSPATPYNAGQPAEDTPSSAGPRISAEDDVDGDGGLGEPEPSTEATEPGETAAPEAVLPAVEPEKPTEAVTTQAPDPAIPYNAGQPAEDTPGRSGPRISAEDDAAIRAHYRRSLEITERKLYERYGKGVPDTTESS
jgi:hypothetical protein